MRRPVLLLFAALAVISSWSTAAHAAGNVTLHLELDPPQARRARPSDLIVWAEIERGWHINGNKPNEGFLVPTEVHFKLPIGVLVETVNYPRPDRRSFAFAPGKELLVYEGKVGMTTALTVAGDFPDQKARIEARLRYQACNDTTCLPPATATTELVVTVVKDESLTAAPAPAAPGRVAGRDAGAWLGEHSLPVTLFLMALLGLGLNLTPCVYPLISITIAFFGRQGRHRPIRIAGLAALYVLGITVSFACVGVAAALSGGLFGALLQKPAVLLFIAALMVMLALSSFGVYHLQAPVWLMRRASGGTRGAVGAFFMGLTMGIVAAPCVGPVILGLLLFVGSRQDVMLGFALFFALGLGMGLPYMGLALVAGSIKALPRSGEWLVWIEHLFGFMLLGMAIYFVSPLLPASIKPFALPALIVAAGVYLGFFDRSGLHQPVFRSLKRGAGVAAVALALWSAVPRPAESAIPWLPFHSGSLDEARTSGRPALVDFVAEWCIPCHEMESKTYADSRVRREAERFAMLRADITAESDEITTVTDAYAVRGVPTVILYDSSGAEAHRLVGYTGPEEMIAAMREVR